MKRLRALAAVLGCLAILAGGLTTVAAAAPPVAPATSAMEAPCAHCDDCNSVPCPTPAAACLPACVGVAPSLAATAVALPMPAVAGEASRPAPPARLTGLSPPPDPFPPRA